MFNLDTFRQLKDSIAGQAKSLGEMAKPYHDNIVGSLAGAAVGGGLGAFATDTDDDKTTGQKWRHRAGNALTGALAGGAVGAAAPMARDYFSVPKTETAPTKGDQVAQYAKNKVNEVASHAPQAVKDTGNFIKKEIAPVANPLEGSDVGRVAAAAPVGTLAGYAAAQATKRPDIAIGNAELQHQHATYKTRYTDVGTPAVAASPAQYDANNNQIKAEVKAQAAVPPAPGHGPFEPASGTKTPMTNAARFAQLERLNANSGRTIAQLAEAGISSRPKTLGKGGWLAFIAGQLAAPAAAYAFGNKPGEKSPASQAVSSTK